MNDNEPFLNISADDVTEACECLLAIQQELEPTQLFVLWVVMAAELLKMFNKVLAEHDKGSMDEVDVFKIGALALGEISAGVDVSDPGTTVH